MDHGNLTQKSEESLTRSDGWERLERVFDPAVKRGPKHRTSTPQMGTKRLNSLASFADQFRRTSGPLLKWTIIAVVGFTVLFGTAVVTMYASLWSFSAAQWFTYEQHFRHVHITATPDRKQCPDAGKPISVEIKNRSSKTVVEWWFWLNATRPGSSFDVSNGGEWKRGIIPPGETLKACASADLIEDATRDDPRSLLWSAGLSAVRFEE
jgi:hypothetical protein